MQWNSRISIFLAVFLTLLLFACENKLTPCECGRNLSKSYEEINQDLEVKCEEYVLNLSNSKRKIWNKQVLDCTAVK